MSPNPRQPANDKPSAQQAHKTNPVHQHTANRSQNGPLKKTRHVQSNPPSARIAPKTTKNGKKYQRGPGEPSNTSINGQIAKLMLAKKNVKTAAAINPPARNLVTCRKYRSRA